MSVGQLNVIIVSNTLVIYCTIKMTLREQSRGTLWFHIKSRTPDQIRTKSPLITKTKRQLTP